MAGFSALRAVSTRNDEPLRARPFDAGRDGFILSEGSGVVVLESLTHAQRRGARIYAELIGYASTCDAYHVTAPEPHGHGAARAMKRALQRAGVEADEIDYINAHATSTEVGDAAETLAIKTVFGERASHSGQLDQIHDRARRRRPAPSKRPPPSWRCATA
jgi:3-oxoacyl-[acyl-carrier-protein] synthase II